MKKILSFILVLALYSSCKAQSSITYQKDAQNLVQIIKASHFAPRPVDDEFSELVLQRLLGQLDPDKIYFTAAQISTLKKASASIDNDLSGNGWSFLPQLIAEYNVALNRIAALNEKIYAESFDFMRQPDVSIDTSWAVDEGVLTNRWRQKIRIDLLNQFFQIRHNQPLALDDKTFLKQFDADARIKSKKAIMHFALRLKNHATGLENVLSRIYLNIIASSFDPHTSYFSATEMQNFISSLSSRGWSFGLSLGEDDNGDVFIMQLTPGGPAWNSGNLNTGDVVRELKWEGKPSIDAVGMSLDEINNILSEDNQSTLTLTVAKQGGLLQTVSLKKAVIENEENIVKSFILSGERKIGFISLPGFYTTLGEGGSQCANDVATEIIKLKKEGIEGLILDLRYNGGGSLSEAIALAGTFIDAGPIALVKDRTGMIQTMKDINRGTVYDGPLVVMVNAFSASASEIVAAVLQDYRRAIIVGSTTFGKATGQSIFPLRANAAAYTTQSKFDVDISHANLTIYRLYRINGKTVQFSGVAPSISLPDVFDSLAFSENTLSGAFRNDSVNKKTYFTPLPLLPLAELKSKSESRIDNSASFTAITKMQKFLADAYASGGEQDLTWNNYKAEMDDYHMALQRFQQVPETSRFEVSFHQFETERMGVDNFVNDFNNTWVKKIKKDILLEEGFNIICDYISIVNRESK